MSKSIYEEALLKLREIAEKLTRKQWIELTNNIELIRSNLQQAQKQEGLLELYKKLLKIEQDDFHEKYKGNSEEYFKAWNETFNKIKDFEK